MSAEYRISCNWKPTLEMVEQRELLALVTDIMAGNYNALVNSPKVRALLDGVSNPGTTQAASASGQVTTSATASSQGRLTPTSKSIALPQNQGLLPPASPGYNLVLQPTGTVTPAEVKRQLFKAVYRGPYIIGPGSFSSQAMQVFIRGAGTATTMLHSDIQMLLAVASDPSLETTRAAVIFDRNLNSNRQSAIGRAEHDSASTFAPSTWATMNVTSAH